MHETVVAQGLLETILHETRRYESKPVSAKISCGQLNAINDESLRFAFDAIADGTPCEGMALHIEHKPLQARCKECSSVYATSPSALQCPNCGSDSFELLSDAPLVLEEITFEKE